ncbi:related to uncharacterized membrane protein [Cephalotrichum gorgonifer]|uniref:Related to uncharacterized membrane protein n=1 Tax=Cephalotrichum gorgonifer TaxID=2041049 RepID=A0AAE8SVD6_9PEZI|nr:related to uncharacterized membrane protein [Cephalotrichum gorgonifer]
MNRFSSLPDPSPTSPSADESRHLLPHGGYSSTTSTSTDTAVDGDVEALSGKMAAAARRKSKKRRRIDPRIISDATIGLSDGLTVPFALTAGLSALGDTRVVIYGGFAELIAGALSMGLGGYLGAKSEMASYRESRATTESHISNDPVAVRSDIRSVFEPFGLPHPAVDVLVDHLSTSPDLTDFLMKFQHSAVEPAESRPLTSGLTIAMGYFLGGFIPLVPYLFVDNVLTGLYISVGVMALTLFAFGYVKTCVVAGWSGSRRVWEGVAGGAQMVVVGGVAAGAAMALVMAFNRLSEPDGGGGGGGEGYGPGKLVWSFGQGQ